MKIVGCDLHARQQTIAMMTPKAASSPRRRLPAKGMSTRVLFSPGRWSDRRHRSHRSNAAVPGIARRVGIEYRVGDPAKIRAKLEKDSGRSMPVESLKRKSLRLQWRISPTAAM
jgi:hypothetical protein